MLKSLAGHFEFHLMLVSYSVTVEESQASAASAGDIKSPFYDQKITNIPNMRHLFI